MVKLAVLHGTLPQLLGQSSSARAVGLEVVRSEADVQSFRAGLAMQRIDALVLSLSLLGSQPLHEIDRLRKYTRTRVTIITYSFADGHLLKAVQERADLVIVREPLTPTRLRGLLARILDQPELATEPSATGGEHTPVSAANALFDELTRREPVARRYDDVQLNRVFEEAIARDYEFTQHVAELLIYLAGFEDYCRRRNAGREGQRGLHTDVERGVAHARALFEEALNRLATATGLPAGQRADEMASDASNVRDLQGRLEGGSKGSA